MTGLPGETNLLSETVTQVTLSIFVVVIDRTEAC